MDYFGAPAQGTPARAAYDAEVREAMRDYAWYEGVYLADAGDDYDHDHDHDMPVPPTQPPPPYTPHPHPHPPPPPHAAVPTPSRRRPRTTQTPPPAAPHQTLRPQPAPAARSPVSAPPLNAHDRAVQDLREMLHSTLKGSIYLSTAYLVSHFLTHTLHHPFRFFRRALVHTEAASLAAMHYFRRLSIPLAALLGAGIAISSGALAWELWLADFVHNSPVRQLAFLDLPSALLVQYLPTRVQTPVYFLVGLSATKRLDRAVFGRHGVFSGVVWRAISAPWRMLWDALEDWSDDHTLRQCGWGELDIEMERNTRAACSHVQRMLEWGLLGLRDDEEREAERRRVNGPDRSRARARASG